MRPCGRRRRHRACCGVTAAPWEALRSASRRAHLRLLAVLRLAARAGAPASTPAAVRARQTSRPDPVHLSCRDARSSRNASAARPAAGPRVDRLAPCFAHSRLAMGGRHLPALVAPSVWCPAPWARWHHTSGQFLVVAGKTHPSTLAPSTAPVGLAQANIGPSSTALRRVSRILRHGARSQIGARRWNAPEGAEGPCEPAPGARARVSHAQVGRRRQGALSPGSRGQARRPRRQSAPGLVPMPRQRQLRRAASGRSARWERSLRSSTRLEPRAIRRIASPWPHRGEPR